MKFQILFCANTDISTSRINEHFGGEGLELGAALENSKQPEGSVRSTLSGLFAELKQQKWSMHGKKWESIKTPLILPPLSSPLRAKKDWHQPCRPPRLQACVAQLEDDAYKCDWAFYTVCICAYSQLHKQVKKNFFLI